MSLLRAGPMRILAILTTIVVESASLCLAADLTSWFQSVRGPNRHDSLAAAFQYHAPSPSDWPQLLRAMNDSNEDVRRSAVWLAGEAAVSGQLVDTETVASALLGALADPSPLVRSHAVISLGKVARRSPALLVGYLNVLEALGSEEASNAADLVTVTATTLGGSILPQLLTSSRRFQDSSRVRFILSETRSEISRDFLVSELSASDPFLRARAAWTLGFIGASDSQSSAALTHALADPDLNVSRAAIIAVGQLALKNAINENTIIARAKQNPELASAAAAILGAIGTPNAAVPFLRALLRDSRAEVRAAAAVSLAEFGSNSAPALPDIIAELDRFKPDSPESEFRPFVIATGKIGHAEERALPSLTRLAIAGSEEAVQVLSQYSSLHIGLLATIASSSAWSYRRSYLSPEVIARLWKADPEGQVKLVDLLRHGSIESRAAAAALLGSTNDNSDTCVSPLVSTLSDKESVVRAGAVISLGSLHAVDSRNRVLKLLKDKDASVQSAALRTLAELSITQEDQAETISILSTLLDSRKVDPEVVVEVLGHFSNQRTQALALLKQAPLTGSVSPSTLSKAFASLDASAADALPSIVHAIGLSREERETDALAQTLAAYGPAAVPYLIPLVGAPSGTPRRSALRALAIIGPPATAAADALLNAVNTPAYPFRTDAIRALVAISDSSAAAPALKRALDDNSTAIRMQAAVAMEQLGLESGRQLTAVLNDASAESFLDQSLRAFSPGRGSTISKQLWSSFGLDALHLSKMAALGSSRKRQASSDSELPSFPIWPLPRPSTREALPREWFGDNRNSLSQAFEHLAKAMDEAGFLDHAVFNLPTGLAIATKVERIKDDGSPYSGEARWTSDKLPLRSLSLADYLGRLLCESPGYFRLFVFVFTRDNTVRTADTPLRESVARALADSDGQRLPDAMRRQMLGDYHCEVLIYQFEKKIGGDVSVTIPSSIQAAIHLQKSHLWEGLSH